MAIPTTVEPAAIERKDELKAALADIRSRVDDAASSPLDKTPTLVAVSKYKPKLDILACHELGQLDFGENYVPELADKAKVLPTTIRWHFIGTLQSNKVKRLASIPNLYSIQTLTSIETAIALNAALPPERSTSPLNVLIQINTSGEHSKSGLNPLKSSSAPTTAKHGITKPDPAELAEHIVRSCPKLRLRGLMTIGAQENSLRSDETCENPDFETLKTTRALLQEYLKRAFREGVHNKWGREGDGFLELSMGMSNDFEAALRADSDIVRVGRGIFGERPKKTESRVSGSCNMV